jgi:hypothetical protein
MQKLYCYVDESGQDTEGRLFLVSVLLTSSEREKLRGKLREIEQISGKGTRKWTKSTRKQCAQYMEAVISNNAFVNTLFYSKYQDTRAYIDLTILTTAKAVLARAKPPYQTTIFVDGLNRPERHRFAAGLRRLDVRVGKVRGIRGQSDELIRLADAVAGFVRDCLQGEGRMPVLYKRAMRKGIIKEI